MRLVRSPRLRVTATAVALAAVAACTSEGSGDSGSTIGGTGSVPDTMTDEIPVDSGVDVAVDTDRHTADTSPDAGTEPAAGTTTTVPPSAGFEPVLLDRTCPGVDFPEVGCHWVEVPAEWDDPASDTIRLPVTLIAASAAGGREEVPREPDAIVIPAGGPGFDNSQVYGWTGAPHNDARDLVLYDQRGTGLAEPSLDCPERDTTWLANLQADTDYRAESQAVIDSMLACRERLERDGIDLDDYDTEVSVRDLDAIRQALGYEQWNILGISYGARLALAAMRSAPDAIRSVILDSVSDVTSGGTAAVLASAERSASLLADACTDDPACAESFGDIGGLRNSLYEAWEAEAVIVEVDLEDGAGPRTFELTGSDLLAGLFNAMYDAALIPLLPSMIACFAEGETTLLPELVRAGVDQGTGAADAMAWAVDCADVGAVDAAADEAVQIDPGRQGALASSEPYCSTWAFEPTSAAFNEPVESDIPALVVAGAFDPVTPPEGSRAAAERLTNATFALFPDAAHGVTRFGATCAEAIELAFLDDPNTSLDLSCIDDIAPVRFVTPDE